jgi:hypothetical protein
MLCFGAIVTRECAMVITLFSLAAREKDWRQNFDPHHAEEARSLNRSRRHQDSGTTIPT